MVSISEGWPRCWSAADRRPGWCCSHPTRTGWRPPLTAVGTGGPVTPNVVRVSRLAEAVDAAVSMTPAGGVILFSPAAPTPEGEGGYRERSRQFVAATGLEAAGRRSG